MQDDADVPLEHRHRPEARGYRRWKERGGIGGWTGYEASQKQKQAALQSLLGNAPESSPEQSAAAFRAEHDTDDLDAQERALLEVGVAPALTPARVAKRFGGMVGIFTAVAAMFAWMGGLRGAGTVVIGVAGALIFFGTLVWSVATHRASPGKPRRRGQRRPRS